MSKRSFLSLDDTELATWLAESSTTHAAALCSAGHVTPRPNTSDLPSEVPAASGIASSVPSDSTSPTAFGSPTAHRESACEPNLRKNFRVSQIRRWTDQVGVSTFEAMSNLPKALRESLSKTFTLRTTTVLEHQGTPEDAEKLLLQLYDGERIECVLLRDDKEHRTACISSQVGCAMHCAFCATGMDGVVRNLESWEMFEEILRLGELLPAGERLTHIVVMGMGEPLANLPNVYAALERASRSEDSNGMGIGARRITISTVGIPSGIRRLAELGCRFHLAISLHAPNDELRDAIVPANQATGIETILEAAQYFFEKTKRRVTFEYVVLGGVNDSPSCARELVSLFRGKPALINLIPYNPVKGLPFHPPHSSTVAEFSEILERAGIEVAIRYRKGEKIDAACGQLRRNRT